MTLPLVVLAVLSPSRPWCTACPSWKTPGREGPLQTLMENFLDPVFAKRDAQHGSDRLRHRSA